MCIVYPLAAGLCAVLGDYMGAEGDLLSCRSYRYRQQETNALKGLYEDRMMGWDGLVRV